MNILLLNLLWFYIIDFDIILQTSFCKNLSLTYFNLVDLAVIALIISNFLIVFLLLSLLLLLRRWCRGLLPIEKLFFELLGKSFLVESELLLLCQLLTMLLIYFIVLWLRLFHSKWHLHLLFHSHLDLHCLIKLDILRNSVLWHSRHLSHLLTLLLL